jgi:hypothetical protein
VAKDNALGQYNLASPSTVSSLNGGQSVGAYNVANSITVRTYDASTVTTTQLASVLGTLIADLRARGLVG